MRVKTTGNDFGNHASIEIVIKAILVVTNYEQTDEHFKREEFFSAEQFPQIVFRSTGNKGSSEEGTLTGEFTIRGTTKPIDVKIENGGIVAAP